MTWKEKKPTNKELADLGRGLLVDPAMSEEYKKRTQAPLTRWVVIRWYWAWNFRPEYDDEGRVVGVKQT